jgi:hypothetical protein
MMIPQYLHIDICNYLPINKGDFMNATKEHCLACGVPAHLAASAEAAGISWLSLLLLAAKYGPIVWTIISTDLAAGKSWPQIVQDLLAVVGLKVPA